MTIQNKYTSVIKDNLIKFQISIGSITNIFILKSSMVGLTNGKGPI